MDQDFVDILYTKDGKPEKCLEFQRDCSVDTLQSYKLPNSLHRQNGDKQQNNFNI